MVSKEGWWLPQQSGRQGARHCCCTGLASAWAEWHGSWQHYVVQAYPCKPTQTYACIHVMVTKECDRLDFAMMKYVVTECNNFWYSWWTVGSSSGVNSCKEQCKVARLLLKLGCMFLHGMFMHGKSVKPSRTCKEGYSKLASLAAARHECLYKTRPKQHMMMEIIVKMSMCDIALNPMCS